MGNDGSRVSVVDVCRGSLVRAQVGAWRGKEAIPLHMDEIKYPSEPGKIYTHRTVFFSYTTPVTLLQTVTHVAGAI